VHVHRPRRRRDGDDLAAAEAVAVKAIHRTIKNRHLTLWFAPSSMRKDYSQDYAVNPRRRSQRRSALEIMFVMMVMMAILFGLAVTAYASLPRFPAFAKSLFLFSSSDPRQNEFRWHHPSIPIPNSLASSSSKRISTYINRPRTALEESRTDTDTDVITDKSDRTGAAVSSLVQPDTRPMSSLSSSKAATTSATMKVGIVGAGAIAFATAAILDKNGHDPMLWSPSSSLSSSMYTRQSTSKDDDDDSKNDKNNNSYIVRCTSTGKNEDNEEQINNFSPRVAMTVQQLVDENDVLVIAIPANGHKAVMDLLVPSLIESSKMTSTRRRRRHHIIISSHSSLGALYLSQQLHKHNEEWGDRRTTGDDDSTTPLESDFPIITAWGTTVCTARKPSPSSSTHYVDIKTIRNSVDLCTIPQQDWIEGLQVCQRLFPDTEFRLRDGLLAISLSNVNPQNHLAMSLGNISRMDKKEQWYQFEHTTPRIGSLLESLDQERLDIAEALGLDVKTLAEHLSLSFHVPSTGSISDMCQEIHRRGNDVLGPNTIDTRYVLEDVPFGLTLIVALGKLVNRPATLHEAGLQICNAMYGRDFASENDLIKALGLDSDQIDLKGLQDAVRTGNFKLPNAK
jgi:opine dehydrogenase